MKTFIKTVAVASAIALSATVFVADSFAKPATDSQSPEDRFLTICALDGKSAIDRKAGKFYCCTHQLCIECDIKMTECELVRVTPADRRQEFTDGNQKAATTQPARKPSPGIIAPNNRAVKALR